MCGWQFFYSFGLLKFDFNLKKKDYCFIFTINVNMLRFKTMVGTIHKNINCQGTLDTIEMYWNNMRNKYNDCHSKKKRKETGSSVNTLDNMKVEIYRHIEV